MAEDTPRNDNEPTITFTNRPVTDDGSPRLPAVRQKGIQHVAFISLSRTLTVAPVHYAARTLPHVDPASLCEGCQLKRRITEEGHLIGWNPRNGQISIYIMTKGAVAAVELYIQQHGDLRGAEIELYRSTGKATAPQRMNIRRTDRPLGTLPACPDIDAALRNLWGTHPDIKTRVKTFEHEVIHAAGAAEPIPFAAAAPEAAAAVNRLSNAWNADAENEKNNGHGNNRSVPKTNGRH